MTVDELIEELEDLRDTVGAGAWPVERYQDSAHWPTLLDVRRRVGGGRRRCQRVVIA